MANLLLDLVSHLITHEKVTASDSFRDGMPDKPDNLVSLYESSGVPARICDAENRSVQIQVRDNSYATCRTRIRDIYSLFHKDEMEDRLMMLTATRWSIVSCRGTPFKLRRDESKRTIFSFNMSIVTHKD